MGVKVRLRVRVRVRVQVRVRVMAVDGELVTLDGLSRTTDLTLTIPTTSPDPHWSAWTEVQDD